jgi:hypothetical protein
MTVRNLIENTGWKVMSGGDSAEITSAYVCDLLSWVMAHANEGAAWITVQSHLNVVAIASLLNLACVIVPESIEIPAGTLSVAQEKGICMISAPCTSYGAAMVLCRLGVCEG